MSASSRNVDFSNVKDGGGFNKARIPAGDYLAIISKVEDAESKGDGVFQYLFSIKIKNRPSSVFPYYCKLQENQLWKLRNIFIAAGKAVPKKRMKVNPNDIIGKLIGVTIEDTEYDGKDQSEVAGVFPASDLPDAPESIVDENDDVTEDDEDLEEESLDIDEPEEEPEAGEADELAALDRSALKARIKELKPDFVVKKSMTDDDLRDTLTDLIADSSPAEDDEEDEDEPEAKPAAKATKKKAAEVTDDELEELDIDAL